ncbi:MAG TPA: ABC transporter substrate-binding protein [Pseudolabrys sp.]|nr:ABC transporter substrate-binding protein [Pseudolabrys sp.]
MKRICTSIAALFVAVLTSSAICAADLPIRIGYQPGTAPRFFVARDQQFFQKAGLAPDYSKFISGPSMLAALQGENIDVAFMTTPPVVFGLSQGIGIEIFFVESDAAKTQALVSTKGGAIKTFADQKGQKIAVTFGTSAHYGLLKSLQAAKLSESDLTILNMQPSAMLPAFIKDDVAGAWSWDPWTAKMQHETGTLVGSLGTLNLPMPGVWVVRTKWLAQNADAIQRFIKALDSAASYMKSNSGDAVKAIESELGVDHATAELIYSRIDVPTLPKQLDGYVAALGTSNTKAGSGMAAHLEDLANFFIQQKQITAKPNLAAAIDPQPLEKYLHTQ